MSKEQFRFNKDPNKALMEAYGMGLVDARTMAKNYGRMKTIEQLYDIIRAAEKRADASTNKK